MQEPVPREVLALFKCPVCKGAIEQKKDLKHVQCADCKTKYPVEEGMPIVLPPKHK